MFSMQELHDLWYPSAIRIQDNQRLSNDNTTNGNGNSNEAESSNNRNNRSLLSSKSNKSTHNNLFKPAPIYLPSGLPEMDIYTPNSVVYSGIEVKPSHIYRQENPNIQNGWDRTNNIKSLRWAQKAWEEKCSEIRNFGYDFLRPIGVPKTIQGFLDAADSSDSESEEQLDLQEVIDEEVDLGEDLDLAENDASSIGFEDEADGQENDSDDVDSIQNQQMNFTQTEIEDESERDLDADIPDPNDSADYYYNTTTDPDIPNSNNISNTERDSNISSEFNMSNVESSIPNEDNINYNYSNNNNRNSNGSTNNDNNAQTYVTEENQDINPENIIIRNSRHNTQNHQEGVPIEVPIDNSISPQHNRYLHTPNTNTNDFLDHYQQRTSTQQISHLRAPRRIRNSTEQPNPNISTEYMDSGSFLSLTRNPTGFTPQHHGTINRNRVFRRRGGLFAEESSSSTANTQSHETNDDNSHPRTSNNDATFGEHDMEMDD